MIHLKLLRSILAILTLILVCLTVYSYKNAPVREELRKTCPVCPAFSIEKIKDVSTAKLYLTASAVSGSLLAGTSFYLRKTKKTK